MAEKTINVAMESSIQEVLAKLDSGGGAVKSVQRGTTTGTSITINRVDPAKCLIILNNSKYTNANGGYANVNGSILSNLTETELKITTNYWYSYSTYTDNNSTVSWQVIEFY